MAFKTFWSEGWGKPYLRPSKTEFYKKKLGPYLKDVTYVTKFFLQNRKIWALRAKFEILLLKNEAFLDGFRLPESFTLATNLF